MSQQFLEDLFEDTAMEAEVQDQILYDIFQYFKKRNLKFPTMEEALHWANAESGEISEQLLARNPGWVRNNPLDHGAYDEEKLMEEISDQALMLMVAGAVSGYDILQLIQDKMKRKLKEHDISLT